MYCPWNLAGIILATFVARAYPVSKTDLPGISIQDEFSSLQRVIIGLGAPYLRDKDKVSAEIMVTVYLNPIAAMNTQFPAPPLA
jgi:hypothetical protein